MRKPPAVATVLGALSLGFALTACSQEAEPTAADPEETADVSTSPASPSSPADLPSSSEPTATMSVIEQPSPTMTSSPSSETSATPDAPGRPVDVASQLLPANRMGKLNAEWTWLVGKDFDIEPEGLVSCNRFGLEVLGAENVAVRQYTSDLDAGVRAHHLVASFADDVTARRAYSVLESWREGCQQRLERKSKGRDGIRVSAPDPVRGAGDTATSYLVITPNPKGASLIEDVAAARDGRIVHLAVVELEGDDYNYPRGRTPAGIAVRNAAS